MGRLPESEYAWYLSASLAMAKKEPVEDGERWFPLAALFKTQYGGMHAADRRDAIIAISRWGKKYNLSVEFWRNGKRTDNKYAEAFVVLKEGSKS